ncbi:MAG: hypothetical protein AAF490_33260, partial [Chloroflexota bacterium]
PGLQGGPHNAITAGIAIAAAEATSPSFKTYASQVRKNADVLASTLMERGVKLVGDGTENHLMLIDLTNYSDGLGTQVAYAMDVAGMYANRNTVPDEPCSPFYPSGIRIGTPLITTRGMKEAEMVKIADWIAQVIEIVKDHKLPEVRKERRQFVANFQKKADANEQLLAIRKEVIATASQFPIFAG